MGNKEILTVGRHTYGHGDISIRCEIPNLSVSIGKFCSIAAGCKILLGADHKSNCLSTYPFGHMGKWKVKSLVHPISKGNIIIGNDVWICNNVTILSGITIGDGAVIGANSVVGKNVPPYAIVVGNPAEVKKYRFTEDQIDKLLTIQWWNWSDKRIQENVDIIMSENIDKFIERHYEPKRNV